MLILSISAGEGGIRILVLYDPRRCIPRRTFKEFCLVPQIDVVLFSGKVERPWPTWPPGCTGPGIAVNKSKCKYLKRF